MSQLLGWRVLPILLFLSLSVFLWRGLSLDPRLLPSVKIGKALPAFTLPQLGKPGSFFDSRALPKQVFLLNVWASWCEACIEEQVFLLQLASKGVAIYGLNYKDGEEDAGSWLEQWGNPYRAIAQDRAGKVAVDLGVYGAPETFVIDKQGIIRYRYAGAMNQKVWQEEVHPLMKTLEKKA